MRKAKWHEDCIAAKRADPTLTSQQLADRYGVKYPAINRVLSPHGLAGPCAAARRKPAGEATIKWSEEERAACEKLHLRGVEPSDTADTLNRIFHNGRTAIAVQAKMRSHNIRWGAEAEEGTFSEARVKRIEVGRAGGLARAWSFSERDRLERARPWHPLHDPKPEWLRQSKTTQA